MKEILFYIIGAFLAFALLQGYIHYKITSGVQAELAKELLKTQNDAIAKKALDTKNYTDVIAKTQEKIITKYKTIKLKDETCEAKLKGLKDAMDSYFNTPNSL
ncbi:hypothetical protein BKH42_06845 [Helicobacter sp. 13S00482-2]|uniref:hypothetical protein n=1 Tax=Helicobacter sp. 13S00482-2 TaxID=1476200 RepID=UPI000BA582F8|nr:hypothetical protein [Helicobacter sp. 13S00482-2]PAF53239.1 hypothetical protein BKH42_06845 [Helicobacter sp. 13S00482-2]